MYGYMSLPSIPSLPQTSSPPLSTTESHTKDHASTRLPTSIVPNPGPYIVAPQLPGLRKIVLALIRSTSASLILGVLKTVNAKKSNFGTIE